MAFLLYALPSASLRVEPGVSFGMLGCGALSRQEEAWEERAKIEEEEGRKGRVRCGDF